MQLLTPSGRPLAVSRKAMERKTGARGLRTILENVLLDTMYDLPAMTNATKVFRVRDVVGVAVDNW